MGTRCPLLCLGGAQFKLLFESVSSKNSSFYSNKYFLKLFITSLKLIGLHQISRGKIHLPNYGLLHNKYYHHQNKRLAKTLYYLLSQEILYRTIQQAFTKIKSMYKFSMGTKFLKKSLGPSGPIWAFFREGMLL